MHGNFFQHFLNEVRILREQRMKPRSPGSGIIRFAGRLSMRDVAAALHPQTRVMVHTPDNNFPSGKN